MYNHVNVFPVKTTIMLLPYVDSCLLTYWDKRLTWACIAHLIIHMQFAFNEVLGSSWSWSYASWIYNYLCNQYLSPQTLRVRIPLMARRCTQNNIMW